MTNIGVNSEVGTLRRVLVHRPDEGISRIRPRRSEELLFDDIVFLPDIQKEHDLFVQVLQSFVGEENVVYVEKLLLEALDQDKEKRDQLIKKVLEFEELPASYANKLLPLENDVLSDVLISGFLANERHILFDPIPNFIFTRDIAVVVRDHIIITKAAKAARYRENLLTHFVIHNHPYFSESIKSNKVIDLNDIEAFPPSKRGEGVSVEGGDMMMVADDYLLVGCSERTTEHAICSLRDELFRRKVVRNVVQINIPNDRAFMHIDTLFTQIRSDVVVCYKPIVYDGQSSKVVVHRDGKSPIEYSSIADFFRGEVNADMKFIFAGNGESPYQEREQWTDGCNLVALKEGLAITYDRNVVTEKAFFESDFYIMSAADFIYNSRKDDFHPDQLENTIITIPSAELSRARGGSHCMTCPLVRS